MASASFSMSTVVFDLLRTRRSSPIQTTRVWPSRFRCSAGQTGFFTKLGRLIKEKTKSDVDKLAVIDELLLYWNLSDTDRVLDELEEDALKKCVSDLVTKKGNKAELQLGFSRPSPPPSGVFFILHRPTFAISLSRSKFEELSSDVTLLHRSSSLSFTVQRLLPPPPSSVSSDLDFHAPPGLLLLHAESS
ncbi:hypothetical protein LOK49_LG03G02327 [Camellia lanceoleosa]|uniref:Uncharacterized protein n=1 Tax=Camellia lanceoleosa TaxID=1840588 RepID=A0ACC0IBQ1_9ERIC|nr:hypothetical protein LOK49_LG03G02327 [Camellia lanceoleosa]